MLRFGFSMLIYMGFNKYSANGPKSCWKIYLYSSWAPKQISHRHSFYPVDSFSYDFYYQGVSVDYG